MRYFVKSTNEIVAVCAYAEDAAALLALYDDGTIQDNQGKVLYHNGVDGIAADSYDEVAQIVHSRLE